MSAKILFSDMDGTLLTSDKQVSSDMRRLLTQLVEAGNRLVLTSGRSLTSIIKVAQRTGLLFPNTLIIAANGNIVYDYDAQRFLMNKSVPMDIARGVIDLAHKHNLHIQSYNDQYVICERNSPELEHYLKFTGTEALLTNDIMKTIGCPPFKLLSVSLKGRSFLEPLRQDVLKYYGDTVTAMFSCDEYLEVFDKTAGKGSAIRFVCDYLQVPVADSVAVGDAENDITMLEAAGIGAAMANADPEVKKHADFITQNDNDHGGLAEVIRKYFLNQP